MPRFFASSAAKSLCTSVLSGTLLYLSTLYPAFVSIWSRCWSFARFVAWLRSSSSMIASASNAGVQITKSAILRSNVFLVALALADKSAPRLTCASTVIDGSASRSRLNIACSLSDSNRFAVGVSFSLCFAFLACIAASSAAAIPATTSAAITKVLIVEASSCIGAAPGQSGCCCFHSFSPSVPV